MASQIQVQVCGADGEVLHTQTVNGRPVTIGRAPGNDMVIEGSAWTHALLWNEDGRLWIKDLNSDQGVYMDNKRIVNPARVDEAEQVRLGEDFQLKLRSGTARAPAKRKGFHNYRLTVDMQSTTGPEAIIEDLDSGTVCRIRSNNRVSVLYLLAKRLNTDAGEADKERGWTPDEEVACGVWGRNWQKQIKSHLHVLVHRIRKDIKAAGLDPWCIEKKRRHTRATMVEAIVR
ncbi:MAG: FHA domain-containing protein [Myxococcota bacterium]